MGNTIPPKHAQTAKNRDELKTENIESYKIIETSEELNEKVTPRLDYSDPEKFVTYGSAEEYYTAAIKNIYGAYPYDGSKNEKNQWHITASGLDNYMFDNEYPRTNGNISISHGGWGTTSTPTGGFYWNRYPDDVEYIFLKGGPNTDASAKSLASLFPSDGGKANVIDAAENQGANLTFDTGTTVEFWMKKDSWPNPSAEPIIEEVVFDMATPDYNFGDSAYGRLAISLYNVIATPDTTDCMRVYYQSGSVDDSVAFDITTPNTIADQQWHHYAVVFDLPNTSFKLYIDGEFKEEQVGASTIGTVSGQLNACIGSMVTASFLANPAIPLPAPNAPGWNKMSGSLDEFRFWKTARTAEEIGLNWNTQVFGGTNTDTANTDLGVYYKFNEGITQTHLDATVLDYSGRISNGSWTGYSPGARSTTSAIVESGAATAEFKDPIIYQQHPLVKALESSKSSTGLLYDQQNNASLYNSMPMWIREEDTGQQNLLKLTQVMSSYLDNLQNSISEASSIKNLQYPSGSETPHNFIKRNVQNLGFETADFFLDATILEKFMDRNNSGDLEYKLNDIKNLIYQNIYNNLTFLMSSKGTEKSFRNLSRCFGISDDLLKLRIYSNNEEYKLEDKYETVSVKKNTIDFNDPSRFEATIHQTSSAATPMRSWISSSMDFNLLHGMTLEGDFVFQQKPDASSPSYFDTPFTKASLFGCHGADSDDLTWLVPDKADLQVYANREQTNGSNAHFQLTSSVLGINLTSSIFGDVYGGERWNLAAKIKNNNLSSTAGIYTLEFQGVNAAGDRIDNSFLLTASLDSAKARDFLEQGKRIYAGAYRTNFTGSVIQKSDALVSGIRHWGKYLSDDAITNHAKDLGSYGIREPNRPVFLAYNDMPAIDTLKLDWNFETATTADAQGEFDIADVSSGSADKVALYGSFGYFHAGRGYGFPANATAVNKEYIPTLKRINPENSNGSDMVKVLTPAEEIQQELSSPTTLAFGIEKSLYQTISDEMLKFFSTSADLASLYMKPTDKYNTANHPLDLVRQVFFDKMQNTPDVNKFYDYFKWIDDAVVQMLRQQLPAGAEVIDGPINVIESHILERNKYLHKTPTYATTKSRVIEGSLRTPNAEKMK
jgi:hypothetical protein